jgi:hypothetical protein
MLEKLLALSSQTNFLATVQPTKAQHVSAHSFKSQSQSFVEEQNDPTFEEISTKLQRIFRMKFELNLLYFVSYLNGSIPIFVFTCYAVSEKR